MVDKNKKQELKAKVLQAVMDEKIREEHPVIEQVSMAEGKFRERVSALIAAFKKYENLKLFPLDFYSYESIARLSLDFSERGVEVEKFYLAESLPARDDLYDRWFTSYLKDSNYEQSREQMHRIVLDEIHSVDILDSASVERGSENLRSRLQNFAYVDYVFYYLLFIETICHAILQYKFVEIIDLFGDQRPVLQARLEQLNKDVEGKISQHDHSVMQSENNKTVERAKDYKQLTKDIQFFRLFLTRKSKLQLSKSLYWKTLDLYNDRFQPGPLGVMYIAEPAESHFDALRLACAYLDIDINDEICSKTKLSVIEKHMLTLQKKGIIDKENDSIEKKVLKTAEHYNLKSSRLYSKQFNKLAKAIDLIIIMNEQGIIRTSLEKPYTWIMAYELINVHNIKFDLPRIDNPSKGPYSYDPETLVDELKRDRETERTTTYDHRHECLVSYFEAASAFYETGNVVLAATILRNKLDISDTLHSLLLLYDEQKVVDLASKYLEEFLKIFL